MCAKPTPDSITLLVESKDIVVARTSLHPLRAPRARWFRFGFGGLSDWDIFPIALHCVRSVALYPWCLCVLTLSTHIQSLTQFFFSLSLCVISLLFSVCDSNIHSLVLSHSSLLWAAAVIFFLLFCFNVFNEQVNQATNTRWCQCMWTVKVIKPTNIIEHRSIKKRQAQQRQRRQRKYKKGKKETQKQKRKIFHWAKMQQNKLWDFVNYLTKDE